MTSDAIKAHPLGARMTTNIERIQAARHQYGCDDIQIDDDASVSVVEDGAWVAAWLWIPTDDDTSLP